MAKSTRDQAADKQQLAAFRKAARELGAVQSDELFKETLRTIAKAKPSPEKRRDRRVTDRRD